MLVRPFFIDLRLSHCTQNHVNRMRSRLYQLSICVALLNMSTCLTCDVSTMQRLPFNTAFPYFLRLISLSKDPANGSSATVSSSSIALLLSCTSPFRIDGGIPIALAVKSNTSSYSAFYVSCCCFIVVL